MGAVAKRKPTARNLRRETARAGEKLARDRERLARLEEGGTAARPIDVESASQIEPHAQSVTCLRCQGPVRLEEHAAPTIEGERLRLVRLACARCGTRRDMWFRIAPRLPS
jgi:RNase P subunit RPR2